MWDHLFVNDCLRTFSWNLLFFRFLSNFVNEYLFTMIYKAVKGLAWRPVLKIEKLSSKVESLNTRWIGVVQFRDTFLYIKSTIFIRFFWKTSILYTRDYKESYAIIKNTCSGTTFKDIRCWNSQLHKFLAGLLKHIWWLGNAAWTARAYAYIWHCFQSFVFTSRWFLWNKKSIFVAKFIRHLISIYKK